MEILNTFIQLSTRTARLPPRLCQKPAIVHLSLVACILPQKNRRTRHRCQINEKHVPPQFSQTTTQNPTKLAALSAGLLEGATDSACSLVHPSKRRLFLQNHLLPDHAGSCVFDVSQAYYRHRQHKAWFLLGNPYRHLSSRRLTYRWKSLGPLPYPTRVGTDPEQVPLEKATELRVSLAR
mmetsp:Transcript_33700/g.81698  ORF Transcript_33700/g.81698 Transcript_33700/m.81698 type:complete len:180 (+) Transcript_33700:177-716(+)